MVLSRVVAVGVGLLCLVAVGCQNKDLKAMQAENQDLKGQLADREARLKAAADPAQLQAMQGEIAARDARIQELEAQLRQPTPGAPNAPGIEGIETKYDPKAGTMTVTLPGDVLFDSGKATLKESAKATLNKIAAALKKDYGTKKVRVEGHTDSDPIVRTKDQWSDNLDLSLNRAAAVTRYLEKQGVKSNLITTSGFGQTQPKGTKPKSRRVEIVVVVG